MDFMKIKIASSLARNSVASHKPFFGALLLRITHQTTETTICERKIMKQSKPYVVERVLFLITFVVCVKSVDWYIRYRICTFWLFSMTIYFERYKDNWCGGSLEYLDDAKCAKMFPKQLDRSWQCEVPASTTLPGSDYQKESPLNSVKVDTSTLSTVVTDSRVNLCAVLTKRVKEADGGVVLYNKYMCAGDYSASVGFETWSRLVAMEILHGLFENFVGAAPRSSRWRTLQAICDRTSHPAPVSSSELTDQLLANTDRHHSETCLLLFVRTTTRRATLPTLCRRISTTSGGGIGSTAC